MELSTATVFSSRRRYGFCGNPNRPISLRPHRSGNGGVLLMESRTVATIDRRHQLLYEEFAEEYLFPNRPVIISGAIDGWRALDNWTPEYFKTKYGSLNVCIDGKNYTMADFIDRVTSSTSANPAP